jgi:hypothetical protein
LSQSPTNVEIDRTADWPPVLASVREYWNEKRGARAMPGRDDISPADFIRSHLPHILLADVVDGGADFRYRLVGTQLREFFYDEPSGKLMSDVIAPFGEETVRLTLETYRRVIAKRGPVRLTGSGAFYGQDPKHFNAFLAPLSDDGATVNMIIGTFVFAWDNEHVFRPPPDPRLTAGAST